MPDDPFGAASAIGCATLLLGLLVLAGIVVLAYLLLQAAP